VNNAGEDQNKERLFFAALLPETLQAAVGVVQKALRKSSANVKWVEPENLHFTLKFLGDTESDLVPALCEVGREVAGAQAPFQVALCGLGAFPNPGWPQVVWLGCSEGEETLANLGQSLDAALEEAGLAPRDKRPFVPHLTLGRAKNNRKLKDLTQYLNQYGEIDLGQMPLGAFYLMKSELLPDGPRYTVLETFSLGA
jgi:2'-5' RNA ligase